VVSAVDRITVGIAAGGTAGAALGGTTTVDAVNGVATFDLSLNEPGENYRLTATDGTETLPVATSSKFAVRANAKSAPTITWATPAAITFGTKLSGLQLDASANVAGSFAYTPVAGTILRAGEHTLSVTFIPSDKADYTTATDCVEIVVNRATPKIIWKTPAPITYGTPLSGTQLDATASTPGTFAYCTALGTILSAGTDALQATFTPTDAKDFTDATATIQLVVKKANQTIAFAPLSNVTFGQSPIHLAATATSGLPVTYDLIWGRATLEGNILTITGPGRIRLQADQAGNNDYNAAAAVDQSFTVLPDRRSR
jgi:hypothetical protein